MGRRLWHRGSGWICPFLHRKYRDSGQGLPTNGQDRLGHLWLSPPSPVKGRAGAGGSRQVFQYSGGGVRKKKKVCTHPTPPSPGPQKVATPGTATASGSLRTGAGAEGPGVAGQTPGRSGARWDAGPQSSRDTCEAGRGHRAPSPRPSRSRSPAALPSACCLVRTPVIR